ncbi:MAG: hypothetical protein KGQ35_12920 [Burkholderiales bacterium]|nr:hypothetical protein [Burkholderiales bacterium]
MAVEIDGRHYYVGPESSLTDGVRVLDPNFIERAEYRALLAGALHYYMKATGHVTQSIDLMVLGLPVSSYFSKRAALKTAGSRIHHVPVPAPLRQGAGGRDVIDMVAKKTIVVPQPFGGLRYALNEDADAGHDLFDANDEVFLVIDPGFNTFDWLLTRGMDPDLESSGSFAGGVSQIVRAVAHAAGMALGVGDLNFVTTERAMKTGVLMHEGRRYDFAPFRSVGLAAAQRVVDEFLLAFNMQGTGVRRIILTGGGAISYLEALRARLPGFDIQIDSASVMGNARGFYLIGKDAMGGEVGD